MILSINLEHKTDTDILNDVYYIYLTRESF